MAKPTLTRSEMLVLEGAAHGELARETAARLALSPETVRRTRSRVMRKYGAKTIGEAIALHAGWKPPKAER